MEADMTSAHRWNIADTITATRMAGALCLTFLPLGSPGFFAVYTLTGLSDALDGWLARKTGSASSFGARLDSIADLLFYAVVLVRLLPVLWAALPVEIWCAVGGILLLRLSAYSVAAVKYRRFASLHTWLNKLTGGAVFLLPYILAVSSGVAYSWALCALAGTASLEELLIHLSREPYDADCKSILRKRTGHGDWGKSK